MLLHSAIQRNSVLFVPATNRAFVTMAYQHHALSNHAVCACAATPFMLACYHAIAPVAYRSRTGDVDVLKREPARAQRCRFIRAACDG